VNIVAQYDRAVQAPARDEAPAVGRQDLVKPATQPAFTRFNVFLRDKFSCQYCGTRDDLTPITCRCAARRPPPDQRGRRLLAVHQEGQSDDGRAKMWPSQMPFQLSVNHLHRKRSRPPNYLHDSWLDYLYWDTGWIRKRHRRGDHSRSGGPCAKPRNMRVDPSRPPLQAVPEWMPPKPAPTAEFQERHLLHPGHSLEHLVLGAIVLSGMPADQNQKSIWRRSVVSRSGSPPSTRPWSRPRCRPWSLRWGPELSVLW
jgi:hypothetical protein